MATTNADAARVNALLGQLLDQPGIDLADGPICIKAGSAAIYVRLVDGLPPAIRVYSPLVRDVESSTALLDELNRINAASSFVRVFWRDRTVFAALEHPTETIDMNELEHACQLVADVADHYDDALQQEFGGHLSFGDREP